MTDQTSYVLLLLAGVLTLGMCLEKETVYDILSKQPQDEIVLSFENDPPGYKTAKRAGDYYWKPYAGPVPASRPIGLWLPIHDDLPGKSVRSHPVGREVDEAKVPFRWGRR